MSADQSLDARALAEQAKKAFAENTGHFDANAILRGAQLTVVGALRALQNPELFQSKHYRQAALAVCAGIVVRLIVAAPIIMIKMSIWFLGFFVNFDAVTWDDKLVEALDVFANHVLQLPFFFMTLIRYVTPTLDNLFMESLAWVDQTYVAKHKKDDPTKLRAMYYPNLSLYPTHGPAVGQKRSAVDAMTTFLVRFGRRAAISTAVYAGSFLPIIGHLVLPAASFYTFRDAVGTAPASVIFATGIFLPKRYLVMFLQSYFASRSLMRELLIPYFARVRFNPEQKRQFFRDREGVLFGFGIGFYIFLKIPLLGVLIYGIAEASTAYLITKITDPPPPPNESALFAEKQVKWRNKHEFLTLPLAAIDSVNALSKVDSTTEKPAVNQTTPTKRFT